MTKTYIAMRAPQAAVTDLIRNLPSVNVTSSTTSGVSGGSDGQAEIRSLTDADSTILLNGGPATSLRFINEDIDSEDIDSITLTPGSAAIDLPATSSAAGVFEITTHNASDTPGGYADVSYGSRNLARGYIRLETGDIANTRLRGYLSYSGTRANTWMGSGTNKRQNVDFGLQDNSDNGSNFKFFGSWNYTDAVEDTYPTAQQFETYKNTGTGYGRSNEYDPANNNYWKGNVTNWNQFTLASPIHIVLPDNFSLDFTPYANIGYGPSYYTGLNVDYTGEYLNSKGVPIPAGTSLTGAYSQGLARQFGAVTELGYDIDEHNHLSVGYWYENNAQTLYLPTNLTPADGDHPVINDNASRIFFPNGLLDKDTLRNGYLVNSLFVQDGAKYLQDRLTISAGFKYVWSSSWNFQQFPSASGNYSSSVNLHNTAPLPHVSVGYQIDPNNQVYINAEGDYRQPAPGNIALNPATDMLPQNQYSIKEELGYRYHDAIFIADASLFNYNITNRLLTTYVNAGQSATINGGNQTARGADVMFSTHPVYGFSPYVSGEYLHATLDSDIPLDGSYIPTKGHRAPLSPEWLGNLGLTYDNGPFFSNVSVHYSDAQIVTLAGDERMPAYFSDTATFGYRLPPMGAVKTPIFRLNFTNITDSIVRTGVTGVTANAGQVRLVNGQLSNASDNSPNRFYVEPPFSITATLSTAF